MHRCLKYFNDFKDIIVKIANKTDNKLIKNPYISKKKKILLKKFHIFEFQM